MPAPVAAFKEDMQRIAGAVMEARSHLQCTVGIAAAMLPLFSMPWTEQPAFFA